MKESESGLFRKSTLERVSSPEQLNEYIKVNNPSLVLMLIGLLIIVISGITWVVSGGIPETPSVDGVMIENSAGEKEISCYVPVGDSQRLKEGMEAQISPSYAGREEYGYIKGNIISIGKEIVTDEYLTSRFENPEIVLPMVTAVQKATKSNVVEVRISVGEWSNEKGKDVVLVNGADCKVAIIVGETKAYKLITNA